MYYINYDNDTGDILGIYYEGYDDVPSPNIAITDEEYEKLDYGEWVVRDGVLTDVSEPSIDGGGIDFPTYGSDSSSAADLQEEYAEKFRELKGAFVGATIMEDRTNVADIRKDYKKLITEYKEELEALGEDEPYEDEEHDHCLICGARLEDGVCPRCHWRRNA